MNELIYYLLGLLTIPAIYGMYKFREWFIKDDYYEIVIEAKKTAIKNQN